MTEDGLVRVRSASLDGVWQWLCSCEEPVSDFARPKDWRLTSLTTDGAAQTESGSSQDLRPGFDRCRGASGFAAVHKAIEHGAGADSHRTMNAAHRRIFSMKTPVRISVPSFSSLATAGTMIPWPVPCLVIMQREAEWPPLPVKCSFHSTPM